ncbi:putative metal-binding motif-containing protein [Candidatus Thiodiazotropha sp. CDECU1]|uniref:putative metal-binding motif-containing protein n=1 Tax=Candidatus Thiodiazotropha sp. CDECU1 TaxID=3065865 RepID=UPI00292DF735|nr:putative metal-binding motif-containing protein [Candidatus Thiodiazotropha sp. CDECU1]
MNKRLTLLMLGAFMLTGLNEANAWGYMETDIVQGCTGLGYDLLSEYQADSCIACHNDDSAKSAYNSGNYEFFCPAPVVAPSCTDADQDGYYVEGDSCGTLADFNDNSGEAYPGAPEDCTDEIDNDGDGLADAADPDAVGCPVACTDMDIDGFAIEGGACGAIDCNDNDSSINPGAAEICSDGVDNNCNGLVDTADSNAVDCPLECTDSDGDGYSTEGGSCGAMDCDDTNAEINPAALEICDDGVDNNCNGSIDSSDAVCQDNSDDDEQSEEPWWRTKGKRHHWHKKDCDEHDRKRSRESDDDDESDEEDDRKSRKSRD